MWRYKILQFKLCHLVVIWQNFAQSLRGSLGSSHLSFIQVIETDPCGDMQHFVFWAKCTGSCFTWVLFGISKLFQQLFVRRVHRCCVQSLVQMGEIAWEEFEKVGLRYFRNLRKKKRLAEMGRAHMTRFSAFQWTRGYKVFECVTKYMWVISQKALSLIIAPPSGENWGR